MNTESIPKRCPKCQTPLPPEAPEGLCAKCLLAAAAAPTEAGQPPQSRSTLPPLARIVAAFPQLEILELIGYGGMGMVYKARQPKLERLVALKLLPQSLAANATFAERFNREARVLARLNHPNIVTVYDFGESGGFFYLLMEFIDGVNLRQAMRAGRFSPQQALFLVPKICEALQFAHDEGVLHRDIKPENILLDTRGRVKIADFGIAKLVGEAKENLTLTGSGIAVGTPHYMAPEQLEHPHDVDQRADIYSLGVVFYEMLTGELPLGRFPPPSQKSGVDPRVDEVVLHALEKERERRYRSAGEVKTSVEAITGHPPGAPATMSCPGSSEVPLARRADCYFSTPKRMRNCFPGPQAHIFHCKGELRLETERLVFITPWQTQVVIPLNKIRDLSIGQFQMWTTPWVMKYERINFLSVTFETARGPWTVHLTPVPPTRALPAQINAHVAQWQQAVLASSGSMPHRSEPAAITVSAQPAWNRKGLPVLALTIIGWWLTITHLPSSATFARDPKWAVVFVLELLIWMLLLWFCYGFLRANSALKSGSLDAVTADEPPDQPSASETENAPGESGVSKRRKPFLWTVSAWIFLLIGLLAAVDTLASLYSRPVSPTFYPGWAHLFAGIALLTLSRRWRVVALAALVLAVIAGAVIGIMMAVSPEHGEVSLPLASFEIPVARQPWTGAAAAVLLALVLLWPCYLLLSAKAKALFAAQPG